VTVATAADRNAMTIEINESGQAPSLAWRLGAILEETPDFVGVSDREGALLFINYAGRKMVGLDPEGATASMKLLDLHPGWAHRIISLEGIPAAVKNGFWMGETAVRRPDGREIPVSQVIVAHRNELGQVEYFSSILRDITERKRAEMMQVRLRRQAALRAAVSVTLSERGVRLQEILRRCSEALVWHLDAAFARIWMFNSEDQPPDDGEEARPAADSNRRPGREASVRGAGLAANGAANGAPIGMGNGFDAGWLTQTVRPYSTNDALNDQRIENKEWFRREGITAFAVIPILSGDRSGGDKSIGCMAVLARQSLEDDTLDELVSLAGLIAHGMERWNAEGEIARSLGQERRARLAAEESSRLKDELLAIISHELRAPLTSILGWTRMLRVGGLDETSVARALCTIERNVSTQARLIGDLLDASRIATGKLQLEMVPVDLMSVIEAAVDSVRPQIEEKRLRLQMVLEPWVGPFKGDLERLRQVVWNLLTNAIKFTPAGGLIEVRLERLEDKALLIVSDTGQGISPEFLPHIFDQFRQADSASTLKHGGLGLGLTIVKRIVELHGGAIHPYSRGPGQGSDFMITFPLATAQPDGAKAIQRYAKSGGGAAEGRSSALSGVRVLVVDDEFDTREVLSAMLTRYGAEVRAVESAADAIRTVAEWNPGALVSDIGLPEEDGYDLIAKVRALPADRGGHVPAIALTAFAGSQDRQRALSLGFQAHLAKPIEPVELARVVARAIGRDEKQIF
jgi:PAS domain S-box-containing protein